MPDASAYTQAINNAVASARSMLGKNEVPNHAELQSYLRDGGQDLDPHKVAWCAAFVSASLQKAGLPVPTQVVKDSAFGPGAYAPNYLSYGNAVDQKSIQAGDILVANNGSHVGFAEGPIRQGANGPEVQLLAGNERDASGQYAPGSYTSPTGAVSNRSQVGMVGERWVPLSQYSARRYQPADDGSQPPAASSSSSTAPSGTTLNSSSVIDALSRNISGIESGGNYGIVNSRTGAAGKYQVMPFNVGPWTQQALGKTLTPAEFRADPAAQEAVFRDQASRALTRMSPVDFASTWFTGKPYSQSGAGKSDYLGTTNANYVTRATQGVPNAGTFTPSTAGITLNTSGAPTVAPAAAPAAAAGGPAAPAAPGQPGQPAGNWASKLASALKPQDKGEGQSGDDQPPSMPQMQLDPPMASGGPMMMGRGGQNTLGRVAAQNYLTQQGFQTQPSLQYAGAGQTPPLIPSTLQSSIQPIAAGQATGIPSLPGTTLNSPSQLQMALMTGQLSPYDIYAQQQGAYGGMNYG